MKQFSTIKQFFPVVFLMLLFSGITAQGQETLIASEDAVVDQSTPDSPWSVHATNLYVEGTTDAQIISYVKFDVSHLQGRVVQAADFSTRGTGDITVQLTRAEDAFDRATTTWNNRPATGSKLASKTYDGSSARRAYTPDGNNLVNYINTRLMNGAQEISFALKYEAGTVDGLTWIGGAGDGSYAPELTLTVEAAASMYGTADAVVDETTPDAPWAGNATNLKVVGTPGSEIISFVKFDISNLAGIEIDNADFSTRGSGTMTVQLAEAGTDFDRATTTWNNMPTTGAKLAAKTYTSNSARTSYAEDGTALVDYINAKISEGATEVAFALKYESGPTEGINWIGGIADGADGSYGPVLTLDFNKTPVMNSAADAYVSQVAPDTNYGGEADQHLINDDTNNASKWNYFKYDIRGAYGAAVNAKLNIYGSVHSEASITSLDVALYGVDDDSWQEDQITWNNKPVTGTTALLSVTLQSGGLWFELSSAEFTNYVNAAIAAGKDFVTIAAKATEETPGNRGWFSGKEWRGSNIELNYETKAATPTFSQEPGLYIPEVAVEISSATSGASIYYTLDGSAPDNTSTLYDGTAITLTETTTIQAIAYAAELENSDVASAEYEVYPVSDPWFEPSPSVSYQENVTISIMVEPAGSTILYSTDGSDPFEFGQVYTGPFTVTQNTTVRAIAGNEDATFISNETQADYTVIGVSADPGVGPGGVGYSDLTRKDQPELGLWLRAHDLTGLSNGDKVNMWNDQSGNGNNAWNDESNVDSRITNTGEDWKEAPTYVENGPNYFPALRFGTQKGETGDIKNLVVNDANNLDGGSGMSIFMVMKRNELVEDFAGIIQKRNITGGDAQQAWIIEMDGGANPNKMQFVVNKEMFIKSLDAFDAENYYLVNVNYNSDQGMASFVIDGETKNAVMYNKAVQATDAPVIIGGFQPMDVTEIAMFNSELNAAQIMIVNHSLAAKYAVSTANDLYSNNSYVMDIVGIGQAQNLSGTASESHLMSSGGGLVLSASDINADGDFVMMGHNGPSINDNNASKSWGRVWYTQVSGGNTDVTLGFDFSTTGVTATPDATFKLWYKSAIGNAWTDMGITPSVAGDMLNFTVPAISNGYYAIGTDEPVPTAIEEIAADANQEAFSIYPNPAESVINVELADAYSGECMIHILNNAGQVVMSEQVLKEAGAFTKELTIDGLPQGTYFVTVIQGGVQTTKAFIKK